MKRTVKMTALLCAAVLLGSLLSGCSAVDSGKLMAVEALANIGQYELAYQLLRDLEGEEAEEWKDKLVFMPLSEVEYDEYGFEERNATYLYDEKMYPMVETMEYSDGGSYRYTYSYDADGNLLTYRSNSQGEDYSSWRQSVATYDADGNRLTLTQTNDDDEEYKYTYTYDERGNRLSKTYEYSYEEWEYDFWGDPSYSVTKTSKREYTYTYDENDNLLTETSKNNEGEWYKYAYTYDGDGNMLTVQWERYGYETDDYGKKTWSTTRRQTQFTYDADGNLLTQVTKYDSGDWEKYVYTYDADGNRLTDRYEDNENDWYQHTYTYDKDGNQLTEQYADAEGEWRKYISTYDKKGNCLTSHYTDSDGDWTKRTNTYDKDGNCVNTSTVDSDGNSWEYINTYDEFGNILTSERQDDGMVSEKVEYQWQLVYYPNGRPDTYLSEYDY